MARTSTHLFLNPSSCRTDWSTSCKCDFFCSDLFLFFFYFCLVWRTVFNSVTLCNWRSQMRIFITHSLDSQGCIVSSNVPWRLGYASWYEYSLGVHVRTQLAFYVNLHRAVIGPSATLTGRWRPDIDLCRMLTGKVLFWHGGSYALLFVDVHYLVSIIACKT